MSRLKNKQFLKKISLALLLIAALATVAFYSYEEKTEFSLHAKVAVNEPVYNFGRASKGERISHRFTIKNISDKPFIIMGIKAEPDVGVRASAVREIISKDQEATIQVSFIGKEEGITEKEITIESNAAKGTILLKITGTIY